MQCWVNLQHIRSENVPSTASRQQRKYINSFIHNDSITCVPSESPVRYCTTLLVARIWKVPSQSSDNLKCANEWKSHCQRPRNRLDPQVHCSWLVRNFRLEQIIAVKNVCIAQQNSKKKTAQNKNALAKRSTVDIPLADVFSKSRTASFRHGWRIPWPRKTGTSIWGMIDGPLLRGVSSSWCSDLGRLVTN